MAILMGDLAPIPTLLVLSPLLLLIEPGVHFLLRRRSGKRLYRRTRQKGMSAVKAMSWQEFERLCASYFTEKGWRVELCGGGGADGGKDLVLRRSGKRVLVQCKHWRARVGVAVVREMFGVMSAERFDRVIIIASSGFTREAWSWAKGKPIQLLDANSLLS